MAVCLRQLKQLAPAATVPPISTVCQTRDFDPYRVTPVKKANLELKYKERCGSSHFVRMNILRQPAPSCYLSHIDKLEMYTVPLTYSVLSSQVEPLKMNESHGDPDKFDRPTEEHLHRVHHVLSTTLPNFFVTPLDYSIYHPDVVFENNIRGTRTVGILPYVKQVALLRTVAHFKFAFVKLDVLKITQHPEDGSVKVRWRIKGISGLKVMLMFWKYKVWKMKEAMDSHELWYDGFSTFYVGSDGLIFKHVADKVMPDSDEKEVKANTSVASKLALLFGLTVARPSISDLNAILFTKRVSRLNSSLPLSKFQ